MDAVTDIFFKKQDFSENKLKEAIKLINENLAVVIAQSQPSPQDTEHCHGLSLPPSLQHTHLCLDFNVLYVENLLDQAEN